MTLHLETITDTMHTIARSIFESLDNGYYLAGGTALALRLGHRKSVDLDYFVSTPIDTTLLKSALTELFPSSDIQFTLEEKNTLWCTIDGVKVSFISRFDTLLEPIEAVDIFRLASLQDITVMKLSAICGREEYKDYFDLACIASITDPRQWASWWGTAYPNADTTSFVIALGYADKVASIPLDTLEPHTAVNVPEVLFVATKTITDYLSLPQ